MRIKVAAIGLVAALAGCATVPAERAAVGPAVGPVRIDLIAFNDFHGNLQPPRQAIAARGAAGDVQVPAGGAAYLATAIRTLREANPNSLVVSAGDLISASPLVSALFLDEPTIYAMNMIGLDYNAVGNHEFDRGRAELLRIANGGCERNTHREPCALDPDFPGARFGYLAANVITETGRPLLPAYAIRSFGSGASEVKVALIGMTLEGTPAVVTPTGIAGLSFRDEADTVNALVPQLEAEGADVIVVLVHEGATTDASYNAKTCEGLRGDLLPILSRLSPKVDVVVSGHTHAAYICDHAEIDPQRPFLLTSAGQYGTLLTHIRLDIDPATGTVVSRQADNLIVQGEGFTSSRGSVATTDLYPRYAADPEVAALVARYAAAAEPRAARVVGQLSGPATHNRSGVGETVLGNLIADAQLAATRSPETGGAQIAFMNPGGVRAEIVPAANGDVTFGQLFAAQPFGNTLVVKSFTGAQIKALLEQQWASGPNSPTQPMVLMPSAGFTYAFDLSRPAGQRVLDARLNGQPLRDDQVYRVTMNGFLASGGDSFTVFRDGTDQVGGPQDIDALEAYFAANRPLALPATNRIRNLTPGR
ncbi:MAG: bifunctional metallophosphatase/5'-nucleotidase [Allosphingosinicella sp.]|uniref:bifunctional metallophosphatase/5'-nucleotidase n=1 Tax=Allosphingosinicella sp. TaxID=2823234 RepID=UPI0039570EA9